MLSRWLWLIPNSLSYLISKCLDVWISFHSDFLRFSDESASRYIAFKIIIVWLLSNIAILVVEESDR